MKDSDHKIQWDQEYTVSKSLVMQFDGNGKLIATNSVSRNPFELTPDVLAIIRCFSKGSTPKDVLSKLKNEYEIKETQFQTLVSLLASNDFLTPNFQEQLSGKQATTLARGGFASLQTQHHMLRDYTRVMAYRSAIFANARDKTVLEIGCGTGILSIFSAKAGAKKVIAIEESEIAALAQEMFKANACEEKIEIRFGNSRNIHIQEPVDIIVHEILGTDPFFENILPFIEDARKRFLKPKDGRMIPNRLEVCCFGIEMNDSSFLSKSNAIQEAEEFSRLYGIDFHPYIDALSKTSVYERRGIRDAKFTPTILSGECLLYDFDFMGELDVGRLNEKRVMKIVKPGSLNAVVLFFRAHLDKTIQLTTSPFTPKTHWGWDIRMLSTTNDVKAGDEVPLWAKIETLLGKQSLAISI